MLWILSVRCVLAASLPEKRSLARGLALMCVLWPWAAAAEGELSFSGVGLDAHGARVAVAEAAPRGTGRLTLLPFSTEGAAQPVAVPEGISPADPAFNAEGTAVIYAGFCPEEGTACSADAPGWNIFESPLGGGAPRQLTKPDLALLRFDPRYDAVAGTAYYLGVARGAQPGLARLAGAAAVFEITDGGASAAVFPRGAYLADKGVIFHPAGALSGAQLLAVRNGALTLKGRLKSPTERPTRFLESGTHDPRVTAFADARFYSTPRHDFRDRATAQTILHVSDSALALATDAPDVVEALGPRLSLHIAAAEDQSGAAFGIVQSLRAEISNAIVRLENGRAEIAQFMPPISAAPLDFEVAGPHALLVVQQSDGSATAFAFSQWEAPREFNLVTRTEP